MGAVLEMQTWMKLKREGRGQERKKIDIENMFNRYRNGGRKEIYLSKVVIVMYDDGMKQLRHAVVVVGFGIDRNLNPFWEYLESIGPGRSTFKKDEGWVQSGDNHGIRQGLSATRLEEISKCKSAVFTSGGLQQMNNVIENSQRNKNENCRKRIERYIVLSRCKLPEEPIYKDAGSGGLLLSTTDLEKQQENEDSFDTFSTTFLRPLF
ncbi:hypothetical protein POM88_012170 [Heracleum sosnowskyi]|uniref:Uncharacterized protein n=1 Tax=Heracleum sosnowskyi TaxID=360622 RepID=A0AAD8IVY0_9APIA|nr:hypothetical protein POM88_012170 [Heracleum sosnowskyi]